MGTLELAFRAERVVELRGNVDGMPQRDPSKAELVTDGQGPEYYPARRPLWARVVLWLCETQKGLALLTVALISGLWVATHLWGWVSAIVFGAFLLGFLFGYWCARRAFVDDGCIPPL